MKKCSAVVGDNTKEMRIASEAFVSMRWCQREDLSHNVSCKAAEKYGRGRSRIFQMTGFHTCGSHGSIDDDRPTIHVFF